VAHIKAQNALLPLYRKKKTEKSTVRVFAVDVSDEERLHLPKIDRNPNRSQRYRWL